MVVSWGVPGWSRQAYLLENSGPISLNLAARAAILIHGPAQVPKTLALDISTSPTLSSPLFAPQSPSGCEEASKAEKDAENPQFGDAKAAPPPWTPVPHLTAVDCHGLATAGENRFFPRLPRQGWSRPLDRNPRSAQTRAWEARDRKRATGASTVTQRRNMSGNW